MSGPFVSQSYSMTFAQAMCYLAGCIITRISRTCTNTFPCKSGLQCPLLGVLMPMGELYL